MIEWDDELLYNDDNNLVYYWIMQFSFLRWERCRKSKGEKEKYVIAYDNLRRSHVLLKEKDPNLFLSFFQFFFLYGIQNTFLAARYFVAL